MQPRPPSFSARLPQAPLARWSPSWSPGTAALLYPKRSTTSSARVAAWGEPPHVAVFASETTQTTRDPVSEHRRSTRTSPRRCSHLHLRQRPAARRTSSSASTPGSSSSPTEAKPPGLRFSPASPPPHHAVPVASKTPPVSPGNANAIGEGEDLGEDFEEEGRAEVREEEVQGQIANQDLVESDR
ncbi:uncharacterized protein [Lolium perenne]|uniref:uncharacterized protein n=1 Tax=Lolium perenne TaxID=4522 RepID=UPI0021F5ABBD|nr:uncharacterized protein LOC127333404 isoform X2 [Lolium perenne]